MRWARFYFASSQDQLNVLLKVIFEYEVRTFLYYFDVNEISASLAPLYLLKSVAFL